MVSHPVVVVLIASTVPLSGLISAWLVTVLPMADGQQTIATLLRPWEVFLPASVWAFGKVCLAKWFGPAAAGGLAVAGIGVALAITPITPWIIDVAFWAIWSASVATAAYASARVSRRPRP